MFVVLVLGLLFWYAGPRLRLEGGTAGQLRLRWGRLGGLLIAACLVTTLNTPLVMAFQTGTVVDPTLPLHIAIDADHQVLKTGDEITFKTVVTYNGSDAQSPAMIVAMNIVNLDGEGDPVDPEDWSPERAQYIAPLASGQSSDQNWTINTILEGDYMVYMVLIPQPDGPEATSQPVASSGIHLTVDPFTSLNPGGVLPLAIGGPVVLGLGIALLLWRRRRKIDSGDT